MSIKDNSYGIADLQEEMLTILKFFIKVCEDNNLRYFAGGGTCIGALRHQGFIPWDDDLDVFMPRPDYEKLWKLWDDKKYGPRFKLCRSTSKKNYHHRVMQMVDLETTFINHRNMNEDIEHGVYIDIIPMDVSADSRVGRVKQIIDSMIYSVYNVQCLPEYNGGKLMRTATAFLLALVKSPQKRYKIWSKAQKRMLVGSWENCNRVVELTTILPSLLHDRPREWFDITKVPFEDIEICVPTGAAEWMESIYGDFMSLPPEESRRIRHNTVKIDLHNSYRNYKGIYYCVNSTNLIRSK